MYLFKCVLYDLNKPLQLFNQPFKSDFNVSNQKYLLSIKTNMFSVCSEKNIPRLICYEYILHSILHSITHCIANPSDPQDTKIFSTQENDVVVFSRCRKTGVNKIKRELKTSKNSIFNFEMEEMSRK